MRALVLPALLLALATPALAEPSVAVRRAGINRSLSGPECLERSRAAFTAAGFRLAESTPSIQIAVSGEYVGTSVCVEGFVVINVAGPRSPEAQRLADLVRDATTGAPRAAPPTAGGKIPMP